MSTDEPDHAEQEAQSVGSEANLDRPREDVMAEVVVLGAGLSGTIMAYELVPQLRHGDKLTLIGQGPRYHFVPSNPWVAIGWRERSDIEVDLESVMRRKGILFLEKGARRVHPEENRIELGDGSSVHYDYLEIATGPDLTFDEVPGLGPNGHAAQGASCFGPAYEFVFILDTELRKRRIRDRVPMTFVTAEPYIGHLGLDGVCDTKRLLESELRERHIKWITSARVKAVEAGKMKVAEVGED